MWLVMLNEIQRFFHGDNIYTTNMVFMCHTIYLASKSHEFGPECCCNELCICHICHTTNHIYKQVVKNRNNIKTRKKVKAHNLFNLLALRTNGFVLCLVCIGLGRGRMWMWQLLQYFFRPKRWHKDSISISRLGKTCESSSSLRKIALQIFFSPFQCI